MSNSVLVYLGLGTNLGQREENLRQALQRLGQASPPLGAGLALPLLRLLRCSSIYETAPWGYLDQPAFLNCVVEAETDLAPTALLALAQRVEQELGRQPTFRYGPRLVDVDILLYGDLTVDLPDLQIPHPRMAQRAFVLVPLAVIAPGVVHPVLKQTVAALLSRLPEPLMQSGVANRGFRVGRGTGV